MYTIERLVLQNPGENMRGFGHHLKKQELMWLVFTCDSIPSSKCSTFKEH